MTSPSGQTTQACCSYCQSNLDRSPTGSKSISYTYTEPTIFFEYALDVSRLANEKGLYNVFVTNGYMSGEMLEAMHPLLDAANVDLKSFSEDFYRRFCKGNLDPVLRNIERMKK